MLQQRVITALVLLAILLPALFYANTVPFTLVVLVLMAAGAWEWGRLSGFGQAGSVAVGVACVALCAGSWALGWVDRPLTALWVVGGGLWVLAAAWLLKAGVPGWPRIPAGVRLVAGVLALWLAWLAVVQARNVGINFLLSVLLLVWVADIFAYFAGRAFGLRFTKGKLAPSISPGKTWEGAAGAAVAVLVFGFGMLAMRGAELQGGVAVIAGVLLAWTAVSIVGDLFESLLKRQAGLKDSGSILPGHGGILDRIDSLTSTLPLVALGAVWLAR